MEEGQVLNPGRDAGQEGERVHKMTAEEQMRTYSFSCRVSVGKEGHVAVVKGLSPSCLQPEEL